MKPKAILHLLLASAVSTLLATTAAARTWTDAKDASKTFEGDLIKIDGEKVHLKLDSGKVIIFKTAVLSASDQAFVKDQAAKLAEASKKAEADKSKKETATAGKLHDALKGNLVRQEGGKFVPMAFEEGKEPQFFIIYFSAKW